MKRAGLYLRASSAGQIDKDYDPEGFTIPAQRELGRRKAADLGAEVIKGMTQKAKAGGTPAMAPLGYLNVRELVEGREVRTVAIDPERGPLIREAFELYATGEWTLRTLLDHLTERGLRSRPNRTR